MAVGRRIEGVEEGLSTTRHQHAAGAYMCDDCRETVEWQTLQGGNRDQDIRAAERARQVYRRNHLHAVTRIAQEPAELGDGKCPLRVAPRPTAINQDGPRLCAERRGAKSSDKPRQGHTARDRLSKTGWHISGYHSSAGCPLTIRPAHPPQRPVRDSWREIPSQPGAASLQSVFRPSAADLRICRSVFKRLHWAYGVRVGPGQGGRESP